MLKYLGKIKFIGDLSLEDADILAKYAKQSFRVLEFGVGGSTQILSQCLPTQLVSVDNSEFWINITKERVQSLIEETHNPVINKPEFYFWDSNKDLNTELHSILSRYNSAFFDTIFVDGFWHYRKPFGLASWDLLKPNGVMIFHDTKRNFDFEIAVDLAKEKFTEIKLIETNAEASNGKSSNMTVLHKKISEPYVNWHNTEGKPEWAYGDPTYKGKLLPWQ